MGNVSCYRNFVIGGHSGSGKTSLCERMLSKAGAIPRCGSIEEKNTVSDFSVEEQEKQSSIYSSALNCQWRDHRFFFVDNPGYGEFIGQYIASVRAADAALVVIDAVEGPLFGTARAWKIAKNRGIPRFGVVNRLDRERADFKATLETMRKNHGRNVIIPLVWPVGKEENFTRVVSIFDENLPDDIAEDVAECRSLWMDAIAETDDELMMRYLDGEKLTVEEIKQGLRKSVIAGKTIPVFPVSAVNDVGITELMDAICEFFPTPLEYVALPGGPSSVQNDGDAFGVVFKAINDPFSGQLTFIRTVSGTFKPDSELFNPVTNTKERIGQLLLLNGKNQSVTDSAGPGTIFAVAKLKDSHVGDTLSTSSAIKPLPGIELPNPVMSYAISAVKQGEDEKILAGLAKICECSPTLRLSRDPETHEQLLSGMGDQQLAIAARRLKEQFRVEVAFSTPKTPYRETITAPAEGHYRHKKQTGGAGQFAEVFLKISYRDEGYEFANEVVGGTIPKNFIPAVEKGIAEVMANGPLVGCTVERVRVAVYDGKYHPVDSNEMAFKIAGRMALRDAFSKAKPVLLEPIMKVAIHIPDAYLGDITGDLNHKRGRVVGMAMDEGTQVVMAEVPLAEMRKYATELRSMTQGKGSFDMDFERYEQVPSNVAAAIIAKHQAEVEKDNE
ncbi:MAG: elongation factor G [Victivallaceae bacterium]|nr:elongation factor G [Victivallaceae bacterium]